MAFDLDILFAKQDGLPERLVAHGVTSHGRVLASRGAVRVRLNFLAASILPSCLRRIAELDAWDVQNRVACHASKRLIDSKDDQP